MPGQLEMGYPADQHCWIQVGEVSRSVGSLSQRPEVVSVLLCALLCSDAELVPRQHSAHCLRWQEKRGHDTGIEAVHNGSRSDLIVLVRDETIAEVP